MAIATWRNSDAPPGPWAGLAATQIDDPVSRLRFLRAAAVVKSRRRARRPARSWYLLIFVLAAGTVSRHPLSAVRVQPVPLVATRSTPRPAAIRLEKISQVWQVESNAEYETYSNGLRIDNRAAVANRPRSYLAFPVARPEDTNGEPRFLPGR